MMEMNDQLDSIVQIGQELINEGTFIKPILLALYIMEWYPYIYK